MDSSNTPKFSALRVKIGGKSGIEFRVHNAIYDRELFALVDSLGYAPVTDITNLRSIICYTAEEIDAARKPLVHYFGPGGKYSTK